jgi:hypothetical protein
LGVCSLPAPRETSAARPARREGERAKRASIAAGLVAPPPRPAGPRAS